MSRWLVMLSCVPVLATCGMRAHAADAVRVEQDAAGMVVHNGDETLHLSVCGPEVIHVVAGPGDPKASSPDQPWIVSPCKPDHFDFARTATEATVSTAKLRVSVTLKDGLLKFSDAAGGKLLDESDREGRHYVAATVNGEKVYHVSQRFMPDALEGIYGLGQHQAGVFNYRGAVVELAQANTDVAIPMLVSTKGYGILWNTASHSYFDNRFPSEMKLTAEAADAIDYYFFYGPEMDDIIHHYRDLTGHVPMYGRWAYGFVQSKDRYRSAKELLDVAGEYRAQHVPLDFIVQDWYWWKTQGDPQYSDEYLKPYPDVPAALRKLHEENIHAMISVWAKMDPKSETFQAMKQKGLTIPDTDDYDATNPAARDYYWDHLMGKKFAEGWDGFWLDSSEPEMFNGYSDASLDEKKLSIGNGARYTNIFPLMHTGGVYDHWRKTTEDKRVFILTRSGFAGQQRYGTTVWSGDVIGTFMTFQRQIPAGLNFQLSGLPYWTTDIAGYGWPLERDTRDPKYQELYTRWFEYGTFCAIMRTHGHRTNNTNELFAYGPATPTLIAYDKLRYRLLPYTYSLAWRVTNEDYTMQRPLVMDWRTDEKVQTIGDQFMFGPAFLVNPVTSEGATHRDVYLPPAAGWYDFWTGEKLKGDQHVDAPAPVDRIPLYVRAGSIVPLGPVVENAEEPLDTIEIRVYPGANGNFTLYADEGDNYDYEKGQYLTVPMSWDDATRTLNVGGVNGSFPGMPNGVNLKVVVVKPNHGVGGAETSTADAEDRYEGRTLSIQVKD